MIRMLIVGYCYGIRFERRLCEEVELHLAYRWFCRLDLDDKVPDHSTFSVNRHGRFRDSDLFRQIFEAVVRACMDAGLVKGEGLRGRCQRHGSRCQPLSRQGSRRDRLVGARTPDAGGSRVPRQPLMTKIPMPIASRRR